MRQGKCVVTKMQGNKCSKCSMRFTFTMQSMSGLVNKSMGDNCTSLSTVGNGHESAVSYSLRLPGLCRPLSTTTHSN